MSNPDVLAGPPADRRPGEVRMTDAGDAEIFDGAGWRPLASLAHDPDTGDRRAEAMREPRGRPAEGEAGGGEAEDTVSPE